MNAIVLVHQRNLNFVVGGKCILHGIPVLNQRGTKIKNCRSLIVIKT